MSDAILTETTPGLEIRPLQVSFVLRATAAIFAAVLATLIFEQAPGSVVAFVYAVPLAVLAWFQNLKGWTRNPALLFALAALSVIAIFIEPGFVNMLTGFGFVAAASLSMRGAGVDDGLRMATRTLLDAVKSPFWVVTDALATVPQVLGMRKSNILAALVVPVVATVVFGFMLLAANPLLEQMAANLIDLSLDSILTWRLIIVFPLTLALCWSVLREGQGLRELPHGPVDARWHHMFFRPASVVSALLLLNAFFLAENLLDIQHVWQNGALPPGFTHAEYVHRGAYSLIITVIMAAAFIMTALRPGSPTAESKAVRALVYLFAAQNFLLVASSVKRTLSYIDDFGMTEWRLAGLIWMGLVAFGLGLTVMRIVQTRDNHWLINANIKASALLMLFCAFADFRPFIADWNVERAIQSGAVGTIDLRYLKSLGVTAIPVTQRLIKAFPKDDMKPPSPDVGRKIYHYSQIEYLCADVKSDARLTQNYWQSWTFRYALLGEVDLDPASGCNIVSAVK